MQCRRARDRRHRHRPWRLSRCRRAGQKLHVLVPETRPYLQGARLTAWELHKGGIPLTLITDNMVGHFLKTGTVGAIVTGADRVAANGDTANKIGTYQIAVLAKENNVPFYIAAPISTFDLTIPDGSSHPHRRTIFRRSRLHQEHSHRARCACSASRVRRHSGALYHRHHYRTRHRPRPYTESLARAGQREASRDRYCAGDSM